MDTTLEEEVNTPTSRTMADDEEEEEICRICRCGEEEGRPLFHPCICTGSIKYVHEDCLLEWLAHSSTNNGSRSKCELCGHSFGFTPVYEPGAPSSLSFVEFATLSVVRALKAVPFLFRVVIVCITWGIFIPIATCVMFRILSLSKLDRHGHFQNAYESAQSSWSSFFLRLRMALEDGYYASWGVGVFASASIFLSFLTLISVVDFVREHDMLTENDAFEQDHDDDIMEIDQPEDHAWVEQPHEQPFVEMADQQQQHVINDEELVQDEGAPFPRDEGVDDAVPFPGEPVDMVPVAPNQNQNQVIPPQQQQIMDEIPNINLDNEDEDNDDDQNMGDLNVALDELLGLRGPIWVLFHNVLWLLTFNGLYLCVALFAPTTVGAVVLSVFARLVDAMFNVKLLNAEDEAFLLRTLHKLRTEKHAEDIKHEEYLESVHGPFGYVRDDVTGLDDNRTCILADYQVQIRKAFFNELHWITLEIGAVLLGYIAVACALVSMYCGAKAFRDSATNGQSRRGWSRITKVLRLMSRTFKVVIIVFLKMGVFPTLLGTLLEIAGRDLVDLGKLNRYEFATEHPVYAVMILWVAGITHMLVITVIVLELRDVLHPDILHGIIRPKDADESLLRTVLEEPIMKHIRRMAFSCAIYTFLVLAFIYIPSKLVLKSRYYWALPYTPNLQYNILEVQLPVELVCIHIGVLNLLDQGKDHIRNAIDSWFAYVCKPLGLTRYLLPIPKPNQPPGPGGEPVLEPRVRPNLWIIRVSIITFFAWVTCLLATFVCISAPLFVGRATVALLQIPIVHEPLVYGIGCLVIWRSLAAAYYMRLHQAPRVVYNMFHIIPMKGYMRWTVFLVLTLYISPWLLGVLIQLELLLPSAHPTECTAQPSSLVFFGWQFPQQLHTLLISVSGVGTATPITKDEPVVANSLTDYIDLSTSPLQNWMVGLVVQFLVVQLLMLPDLMQQREVLNHIHQRLVTAVQDIRTNYDCTNMLNKVVLPAFLLQVAALVGPLAISGMIDFAVFVMFGGYSCCLNYGLVQMFRRASAFLTIFVSTPYLALEAHKTWTVIHDALRDERYLIGKRLHNMEKRQMRSSRSVVF